MKQAPLVSRRNFMKILAISGAASGIALRFNDNWLDFLDPNLPELIQETHYLMGCVVNLTLLIDDPARARKAAKAALAEMQRLANIFTRFDPSSQVSRLNAGGVLASPDPQLVTILQRAHDISHASQGAFDITIKPLFDLYQINRGKRLPGYDEIRTVLKVVDYSKIVIDAHEIGFSLPGMSLTLDGIGKGAVIDAGVKCLRERGYGDVIVEAGGDLLASGTNSSDTPWRIGLRPPRQGENLALPELNVQNMAVATSGDYLQPFVADQSAHHILDPRRGVSSLDLASATVVAPSAALADALATAIMAAGKKAGLELLNTFPNCKAYLITKDLHTVSSPGMDQYLA